MGFKDEYLFKDVLTNNVVLLGAVTSVIAVAVVFFVFAKGAYKKQAEDKVKEAVEKTNYQVGQVKENIENNNLLWTLIDSTWKSPDKSIAFVKKLAAAQKLPSCGGKACTGDDACLMTSIGNNPSNPKERNITVGWRSKDGCKGQGGYKYKFKVLYDAKDKFVTIDVNDLLGKSTPNSGAEEPEEASQ